MFQIAAGRSFPQKTKQNRHGDIKFLDELAQNESEFVQVNKQTITAEHSVATMILVDFAWQAVFKMQPTVRKLHPTSGAVTAALDGHR